MAALVLLIYLTFFVVVSDFGTYVAIICNSSFCSCFSGFFRSDSLIGTVNAKLTPLETQCTVHDAFDVSNENIVSCGGAF